MKLEREPGRGRLELAPQLALAHDHEARVREALEDRGRRLDERALVLLLDEPRDVADDEALVGARLDREAAQVDPERDHDALAPVRLAVGLGGVDHLRMGRPAGAPERPADEVVLPRQLGRVVSDEHPGNAGEPGREEGGRPHVDDVDESGPQRAQLAHEVA